MKKSNKAKKSGLGGLTASALIELHSVESIRLWHKKDSKAASFGQALKNLSTLEYSARHDDPYADFALLEIEQMMNQAFGDYTQSLASLPSLTSSRIQFGEVQSSKPIKRELFINSRFGWRLVALLESFDVLMVRLADANFKAQLSRKVFEAQKRAAIQTMQHVLDTSASMQHSGITRQDITANNAKAIAAQEKHGAVPFEVLEGVERAEFAPEIRG